MLILINALNPPTSRGVWSTGSDKYILAQRVMIVKIICTGVECYERKWFTEGKIYDLDAVKSHTFDCSVTDDDGFKWFLVGNNTQDAIEDLYLFVESNFEEAVEDEELV